MQDKMVLHLYRLKALCLGWYDKGNCGDESYKFTFKKLFPNLDIDFVDKIDNNKLKNYDIVILGGGNIIDNKFLNEIDKIDNLDIYAFSVGVSEDIDVNKIKKIKKIYVRDFQSLNYLKQIGYDNCIFCPDAAFSLEPDKVRGKKLIKNYFKDKDLYENVISIIISSYFIKGRDELYRESLAFQKFAIDMSSIIDSTNASFIFIPFSTQEPKDDRVSNAWIASKCKYWNKNKVIYDEINFKDALDIISASKMSINTRLHASIFSCVSEVPFIDITHHSKNLNFLETINKTNLSIDYWNFNINKTKELIDNIIDKDKGKEFLCKINKEMKDRLKWCSDGLCFNKE